MTRAGWKEQCRAGKTQINCYLFCLQKDTALHQPMEGAEAFISCRCPEATERVQRKPLNMTTSVSLYRPREMAIFLPSRDQA